ncbi:MAG: hypothetical protein DDT30_01911 [Dehalococcoidia bacterium]|nr:hypothetical protein [Bacillota bacterium]
MSEERKGYPWPASALTRREMAILSYWREKTGMPITEVLRQAVIEMDIRHEQQGKKTEG